MTEGVGPAAVCSCGCDCDACTGIRAETPIAISNAPGLPAIAYRVGTHAEFKASMLAGLTSSMLPALAGLGTREDSDLSIGIIDAWASVAEVLTFYQERIANESYLRTATERLSVVELARLIGYAPRAGVAATAYLAFTMDTTAGSPSPVTVPAGSKVGSIPGPNEQPQTFETADDLLAIAKLNSIGARLVQPQAITVDSKSVVLAGLVSTIKHGDRILIVEGAHQKLQTAFQVTPDSSTQTTRIDFEPDPPVQPYVAGSFPPSSALGEELSSSAVRNAVLGTSWDAADLNAEAIIHGWSPSELESTIRGLIAGEPSTVAATTSADDGVYAFGTRASVFGHNAPSYTMLNPVPPVPNWENKTLFQEDGSQPGNVNLDAVYPRIVAPSFAALVDGSTTVIAKVGAVNEGSLAEYLLSSKATILDLDPLSNGIDALTIRGTSVFAESLQLTLADVPIPDSVEGIEIELDDYYAGLTAGRVVIVTGELDDDSSRVASEIVMIDHVNVEGGYTVIALVAPGLANSYLRTTVAIAANVVRATHGESKSEVLGSGDGSQTYQRFTLQQPPLTYVSAQNASGAATTLAVFVDGVLWHEAESLYGQSPSARVFVTERSDSQATTVEFGDGQTGSRLPTGVENVTATYRKGIGVPGMVKAGQLSLLTTKPLGIRSVVNPVDAAGGTDPESLDDARSNAPTTVLTLDRVVSTTDYEDFAQSFAGIAKALATELPGPNGPSVVLTIAGTGGATVPEGGDLGTNLRDAIVGDGDVGARFRLASYRAVPFQIVASVKVDPDYLAANVLPAVETALRSAFSFDSRKFGQPVADSEVIEVMHSVPGVVAAVVQSLFKSSATGGLSARLWAQIPEPGDATLLGAELLTLDPRPLDLGLIQ